jgi:hypothetical protein
MPSNVQRLCARHSQLNKIQDIASAIVRQRCERLGIGSKLDYKGISRSGKDRGTSIGRGPEEGRAKLGSKQGHVRGRHRPHRRIKAHTMRYCRRDESDRGCSNSNKGSAVVLEEGAACLVSGQV